MIAAALLTALVSPPAAGQDPQGARPGERALPALSERPRDATGEGLAFVELAAERPEVYLEEPIRLRLRFGFEEEFLRTRAVQPFRQPLGVPAQLDAPWLAGLPGAEALETPSEPAAGDPAGPTVAVNGAPRQARRVADRTLGDGRFRVYEVEASLLPTSVGALALPAPALAFAYATRFEESLLAERAPVDRVDAFVRGEPLTLEVVALPEEGRPWEFTGAVGRFTARAAVDPREIAVGESLKLALTIEGQGNLGRFEAPSWRTIGDFRVRGTLDERAPGARVLTYDLAPTRAGIREVPALQLAYFDPGPPARYRWASTEPVGVVVRPAAGGESAGEPGTQGPSGGRRPAGERRAPGRRTPLWVPLAALGALALLGLWIALRRS